MTQLTIEHREQLIRLLDKYFINAKITKGIWTYSYTRKGFKVIIDTHITGDYITVSLLTNKNQFDCVTVENLNDTVAKLLIIFNIKD